MGSAVGDGLNKIPGKLFFFETMSYYAARGGLELIILLLLLPKGWGFRLILLCTTDKKSPYRES